MTDILIKKKSSLNSGFTLLEVIIAMAIMVLAFSSILAVEQGSLNATTRAKQMNVVGMLAKNQMVEMEFKMEGKPFTEVRKEETGTFPEPYTDYTWKTSVKELTFPSVGSGGSGKGKEEGQGAMQDMLGKMISNFLSKAIREVTVTILWKKGKGEQKFTLSTYWVDLNYQVKIDAF